MRCAALRPQLRLHGLVLSSQSLGATRARVLLKIRPSAQRQEIRSSAIDEASINEVLKNPSPATPHQHTRLFQTLFRAIKISRPGGGSTSHLKKKKPERKVKGDRSVVISIVLSLNYLTPHTVRLSEMSSDLHPSVPHRTQRATY